ncbi:MAG: class II fructose-bisphosphate aldolase [Candidatus Micrarchaeota archaeon]
MTLTTLKEVLAKADKGGYAVGAFNTCNLEITKAIVLGAEAQNSPVIIETAQHELDYAGFEFLACIAKRACESMEVPAVLHLDHATDLNTVKKAIAAGYSSVMFDGSHFPFEKNVSLTKQVVELAHSKGISVEGELGTIGGAGENAAKDIVLTDPQKAKEFVELTGVDALAVAIGTSHGAYKFTDPNAELDIKRLTAIKKITQMPLVLHGASTVPRDVIDLSQRFGALLGTVRGVNEKELKRAVKSGINKVNTGTDLRLAFTAALRETLMSSPREFDPRKILPPSIELMQRVVENKIKLLGSAGKA